MCIYIIVKKDKKEKKKRIKQIIAETNFNLEPQMKQLYIVLSVSTAEPQMQIEPRMKQHLALEECKKKLIDKVLFIIYVKSIIYY